MVQLWQSGTGFSAGGGKRAKINAIHEEVS
jgi:hypothetical protein